MFTKNPFNKKDEVADMIGNILEADYKVKKEELKGNQHKIDMNKNNKIDAHDFKLLRSKGTQKEEVEQIDEIGDTPAGKRALRAVQNRAVDTMSDPSKSSKQVNKAVGAGVSAGNRLHGFGHDRMKKNTVMGRDALRKQLGVKEEVEQIDELNKDTLYSYNKKAGADVEKKDKSLGQLIRKGDSAGANKAARQLNNRLAGQERAEKRLNKEEVEQIDERELTKGETKEKERIVKGMKKSLSGFKQRYGDRAKSVMYATATKAAKKG